MTLTSQDIVKIANLARLEIPPAAAGNMLEKLNGFFDIVERMRAVDTNGIEPLAHPSAGYLPDEVLAYYRRGEEQNTPQPRLRPSELRLRPDVVSEFNNREANQRSAPAVERGLFLVPKVIE